MNTGVDSLSLFQQILPTQDSKQGLLHCKQILYQLSYQGSPLKKQFPSIVINISWKNESFNSQPPQEKKDGISERKTIFSKKSWQFNTVI